MRSREFLQHPQWSGFVDEGARFPPHWSGARGLLRLSRRSVGTGVRDAASSWVRTVELPTGRAFVKTYDYPSPRARWRGLFRNTAFARSRARREFEAAAWLREHDFATWEVLALGEWRFGPMLRRAVLVTRALPGRSIEDWWPRLDLGERRRLRATLDRWLEALHHQGFRDRNLDPRNLIVHRVGDGFTIANIDSPRFRLRRPSPADRPPQDRLALSDRDRLLQGLDRLDRSRAGSPAGIP